MNLQNRGNDVSFWVFIGDKMGARFYLGEKRGLQGVEKRQAKRHGNVYHIHAHIDSYPPI
jgi:hypothetical protein